MGIARLLGALAFSLVLVNCAKSKTGPSTTAASTANAVQAGQTIVCPVSGYYMFNSVNYSCIPGQQVTAGAINGTATPVTPTPTPAPIPVAPSPMPNPIPAAKPPRNACDAFTAQYNGVVYVVAYYQGSFVCMREDLAEYYHLAVY